MQFASTRDLSGSMVALASAVAAVGGFLLFTPHICAAICAIITVELEQRFIAPRDLSNGGVAGIIALGGSHERVVEAVRLMHRFPDTKLIITGAPAEDVAYAASQGMQDRLIIEPQATSTFENALFSRQLLSPRIADKWLLVTSAVHMPRAIGTFRSAGFSVLPWPVFDRSDNFSDTPRTLHEVFGLLEYWMLGRIGSLFPAPGN